MKIKKCYVCQNSKSKKVCQFYGINYVQCTKCKLVYTDRVVSEEGIKSYDESIRYVYDSKYKSLINSNKTNLLLARRLVRRTGVVEFLKTISLFPDDISKELNKEYNPTINNPNNGIYHQ